MLKLRNGFSMSLAGLVCLAATVAVVAPASAQGPGIPRTYVPRIIDSPDPQDSNSMGWGLTSADVTGDGELDMIIAQSNPPANAGQFWIFDGVTRQVVDRVLPPESNPPGGGQETFAYVYVETMPDLGSCPGGDGPDPGRICDLTTMGPGDGIPEIIAGSRAFRVNAANTNTPATASDPNIGRGYVFDGATRAVLKRIDMPVADRTAPGGQAGAQFGRMMMNPSGLPPCTGLRSENNNSGVSDCPNRPLGERIGDVDGGGKPDIVITARNYRQLSNTAFPGSLCAAAPANTQCAGAGKAWLYRGEDIAGTNPNTILDTAAQDYPHPRAHPTAGGEYGGNVWRVGDVTGDGLPEFVIPDRNQDYPLNNPDTVGLEDIGASFMWSGKQRFLTNPDRFVACSGAECMLRVQQHPEPQPRVQFPNNFNSGRPTGNLGATDTPDFLQPSPLQNVTAADQGRVYVFNGDLAAAGGAEQSHQFAQFDDPTPFQGGTFGGGTTGAGDLVQDTRHPANEVIVGGFHFDNFSEVANSTPSDLHIMNPGTGRNLLTIPHPTQTPGDGLGVGLTPMGDLNDDGFLDFAASAYLANVGLTAGAGRAFIFYSDNSPRPPLPRSPSPKASSPKVFKAGACANDFLGTNRSETLNGSDSGDRMAGYGGNDIINGFHDDDCLHGGTGDDRERGGPGEDKLLGSSGRDRLNGGPERDQLFGGSGRDRLAGAFGRDRLYGGSGNDRLSGGGHGDRLFGERGNDRIHAGGAGDGPNRVDAGPGSDVVNVRNKHKDYVRCGAGRDRVIADRNDRLFDCERVRFRR